MAKRKKGQTMIIKIVHRKQKIEQYEPYLKMEVNSGLLNQTWQQWSLRLVWMVPIKIISDKYKLYPKLHYIKLHYIKFLYG